jgi:hypothetical protein
MFLPVFIFFLVSHRPPLFREAVVISTSCELFRPDDRRPTTDDDL